MTDYASYSTGTHRAGEFGYQRGRMPGEVVIWEDNKLYRYKVPQAERGDFKAWAKETFAGANRARLRGAWPEYTVQQP